MKKAILLLSIFLFFSVSVTGMELAHSKNCVASSSDFGTNCNQAIDSGNTSQGWTSGSTQNITVDLNASYYLRSILIKGFQPDISDNKSGKSVV